MADAAAAPLTALAAQQPSDEAAEQTKADDEQMNGAFAAVAFGGKVEAVFKAADDDEDDDDDEDEIEQESEPEVDKNEELQVALEKNYAYFALAICPAAHHGGGQGNRLELGAPCDLVRRAAFPATASADGLSQVYHRPRLGRWHLAAEHRKTRWRDHE